MPEPGRRAVAVRALATVRAHPRHLVLAGAVAGLLLGPFSTGAVVAAALLATTLAGRKPAAVLAAAAVLGGAAVADARLAALDDGVLAHLHGRATSTRVVLLEPMRARGFGRSDGRVRLLDGPGRGEQAVLRARVRHADVGDVLAVRGSVEPLKPWEAYQRRRNAHAAIAATRAWATGERRGGIAGALDGVRRSAEAGLAGGLAPAEAALLRGMVLGEDERLTDDVREDFQRSGLAHILAVSGQNVMLLVALVLGACAVVGVPLRARLLLAAATVAVYVPLAGGGPSILRAGAMGLAGLVAALAGRPAHRWYALLLAAAVTLALNPRAAGEPGWQLSFAAVAALLISVAPLRRALARRMPRAVADAAAITIAATLGTAPLMALHFEQVSLAALPANLLAAPAIAPVMWLGMLAAAAAQIAPALAVPFSALTGPLLVYLQHVAHTTASSPLSVVAVHASPAAIAAGWLAVVAAAAAALHRWGGPPAEATRTGGARRRRRRVAVAVAGAIAVVGASEAAGRGNVRALPAPDEVVVSFLDVGQGDATLVQHGKLSVLVDTGPPDGPVLERLRKAGIERLDALVLTHAEADHEGAAPEVIARLRPRVVVNGGAGWRSPVQRVLPQALAAVGARLHAPKAGEVITIGRLRFEVFWPPPGDRTQGDPNEHALVARLEAGGLSVLLAADAESPVTSRLALEPVDVLKVAHHGSADPGLPALLARLRPRIAAIEVGAENRYGHPAPSTLAALRVAGPTVLRTDESGTARVHARAGRVWIER